MDVANASVYDAAAACGEAALMALRTYRGKRKRFLIAHSLHPHYRQLVEHYLSCQQVELVIIPSFEDGRLDIEALRDSCDENVAGILLQSPNFFGTMEDVKSCAAIAEAQGALTILCANPMAYGLFQSAFEQGVDIAVGDTQPFGLALNFGGPYAGYMACRQKLVRQMPARIVGQTEDTEGRPGFVLTLQAREQHIRREKATSNICTSQTLATLASLIGVLWYGKQGVRKVALTNYQRTAYLRDKLKEISGVKVLTENHFNEFVLRLSKPVDKVLEACQKEGIVGGLPLKSCFPEMDDCLLIAVTETKSKEQLDHYVDVLKGCVA
jgi:glycine dehydrogenase subunit 1